jgi:hypothetical protein
LAVLLFLRDGNAISALSKVQLCFLATSICSIPPEFSSYDLLGAGQWHVTFMSLIGRQSRLIDVLLIGNGEESHFSSRFRRDPTRF